MTRTKAPNRRGFTLLELIVVITIIGILGTVVVTKMIGHTDTARQTKIRYDLKEIVKAAELIRITTSDWPESIEAMVNATHPETGEPIAGSLKKQPKDPWGNPYEYELIGDQVVVRCLGKDGAPGGEGENRDVQEPEEGDMEGY